MEDNLRALAAGRPVANAALLPTCRLSALGTTFYGAEEVAESFRRTPFAGAEPTHVVRTPLQAALFWPDAALVADLSGDYVARLWRLGPGTPLPREREVSVPLDPDLAQAPDPVQLAASDHPELSPHHVEQAVAAGRELSQGWVDRDGLPALRARAFALRAFSNGETWIVLFAVHLLSGDGARKAGFVHAVTQCVNGQTTTIRDLAGETALAEAGWTPRIG